GGNILSNVCDVDLKLVIAIFKPANKNRIIEVASCLAIDSHYGQVAVVLAAHQFQAGDVGPNGLCFFQHIVGENMRQVVFANDDLDVYPEVVLVAENFDDAAAWVLCGRGPVSDLNIYDHAFKISDCCSSGLVPQDAMRGGLRRLFGFGDLLAGRDDDDLGDFFVDGFDVIVAFAVM